MLFLYLLRLRERHVVILKDNVLTTDNFLKQGIPNAAHVTNNMSAPALPAPAAVLGNVGTVQGPSSGNATSSSHIKSSNAAVKLGENKASVTVEASADSSKKDQASSECIRFYIYIYVIYKIKILR